MEGQREVSPFRMTTAPPSISQLSSVPSEEQLEESFRQAIISDTINDSSSAAPPSTLHSHPLISDDNHFAPLGLPDPTSSSNVVVTHASHLQVIESDHELDMECSCDSCSRHHVQVLPPESDLDDDSETDTEEAIYGRSASAITSLDRVQTQLIQQSQMSMNSLKSLSDTFIRAKDPQKTKELVLFIQSAKEILRKGIPQNKSPEGVIDDVVTVFSAARLRFPIEGSSKIKEGLSLSSSSVKKLSPSWPFDSSENNNIENPTYLIPWNIIEHNGNITGDWKIFFTSNTPHRELILEGLRAKFKTGDFTEDHRGKGEDWKLFEKFKPMELIGDLVIYALLGVIDGDYMAGTDVALKLKRLLMSSDLYKRKEFDAVYKFLDYSISALIEHLFLVQVSKRELPSDKNWTFEMLNNRFILWYFVEKKMSTKEPDALEMVQVSFN